MGLDRDDFKRLSRTAEATVAHRVDVPECGGSVGLRDLTFSEWHRIALEHRALDGKEPPAELICRTLAVVLANPDGSRMFTDAEASEIDRLPPAVVMRLYVAAWDSVLRGPEATDDAKKD